MFSKTTATFLINNMFAYCMGGFNFPARLCHVLINSK